MPFVNSRSSVLLSGVALASLLTACVSNPFNRDRDAKEEAAAEQAADQPQDDRIPVLALQESLEPDIRFIGEKISIPPAFANSEWSQPGGEPDHAMHHLGGPDSYSFAWQSSIGQGGGIRQPFTSPPVVSDRRVFTADAAANLSAFDTETGAQIWTTSLTPESDEKRRRFFSMGPRTKPGELGFGGGVALDGGRLFMASGFGFAAGLDADSGAPLWQVQLPAPVRNPPTAANGFVYLLTTANQVLCLDQQTGETVWTYESFEENARFLSTGSVAVDGDLVIAPFSSGEIVALDNSTGRLLWSATVARSSRLNALSNLNDIAGSPVADRGAVFAVSHSGQLSAIDGRTGRLVWEKPVAGLNMPWISGDYLFVVSVDGTLLAMSRNDGAVVWRTDLPAYENEKKQKNAITWSGPILAGDSLILTSSAGQMIQVSPEKGDILETHKLKAPSTLPPVVADGTVFVINNKGKVEAWR